MGGAVWAPRLAWQPPPLNTSGVLESPGLLLAGRGKGASCSVPGPIWVLILLSRVTLTAVLKTKYHDYSRLANVKTKD